MTPVLLSDHLLEALAAMERARKAARKEPLHHRETIVNEINEAELSITRVLHLIVGCPES